LSIGQYYHILNDSETGLLFDSLQEIFYQIFEFEIENRQVRRRFTLVTESNPQDSYQNTTHRVLTSRQKKNQKQQDDYNSSFISAEGTSAASFMLKNSVVEPEDYLATERDEGSGSKFDMSMMDSSIICETMDGELD